MRGQETGSSQRKRRPKHGRIQGVILSLALSLEEPEVWHTYGRQLRSYTHSYVNLYIPEKAPSDRLEMILPILLTCARFLNRMRDDKILSNLLEKIFEDLHIDSKSPSAEWMLLLPLYDLYAINLVRMGHDKYALQLLEDVVKI